MISRANSSDSIKTPMKTNTSTDMIEHAKDLSNSFIVVKCFQSSDDHFS